MGDAMTRMSPEREAEIREADSAWTVDLMRTGCGACIPHRRELLAELDATREERGDAERNLRAAVIEQLDSLVINSHLMHGDHGPEYVYADSIRNLIDDLKAQQ
jgi:hypothetical protein